jgi:hypothetical protein
VSGLVVMDVLKLGCRLGFVARLEEMGALVSVGCSWSA